MVDTFDAQAFAVAMELADQLSGNGAFVDDCDEHLCDADCDIEVCVRSEERVRRASLHVVTGGGSRSYTSFRAAASPVHACAEIRSSSSVAWWSLVDRAADVSSEDLLAMTW
ncbi:unnamed protein product [Hyaloperonospora brassicae]|uniref:Uncharacterized protein n=1 Tax=Hyaloperonospora brassicae TaxID=162125 RepID=A0AAV0TD12_HYABA|nr:unnamed protein product [Hyaloperonospora brassicae]